MSAGAVRSYGRSMVVRLLAMVLVLVFVAPVSAAADRCARLWVPMAERQVVSCVDELTTAGGHTNPADWAGLTHSGLPQPSGVPGIQIDGYFPDTSRTNTNHGWNHDSQFVLRLPNRWNGGLVVTGSPGNRRQYANDRAIADFVLSKGYAFAATDKGNTGVAFHEDGRRPGDAILEWHTRVTQLTVAAKAVVAQRYGRPPGLTLAAGISNGGYLVRWQLENNPRLFDGGVDWEGTLWRPDGPNLLTFLPPALRGDMSAFPPESAFLWPYHREVYWGLTQRIYRTELDPTYTGDEAAYSYASRPPSVKAAVARISLTGRIARPLITLHGTLDALLPITETSDVYASMVQAQGRSHLHRYVRVEAANHADGLVDTYPTLLEPLAPHFHKAIDQVTHFWS
jgi:hypothetical protein